jgi:D-lactate dehydrogenase (cytochrome)
VGAGGSGLVLVTGAKLYLNSTSGLDALFTSPSQVSKAVEELQRLFPEEGRVLTEKDVVHTYGASENSYHPSSPHAVIVIPNSTQDVVNIVNIARKWRVPIVPYSGATSLEGHFSGVSMRTFVPDLFYCSHTV